MVTERAACEARSAGTTGLLRGTIVGNPVFGWAYEAKDELE